MADRDVFMSQIVCRDCLRLPPWRNPGSQSGRKLKIMKCRSTRVVVAVLLLGTAFPKHLSSQVTPAAQAAGPYARIAILRATDEAHSVDLESGYIRHLAWHRQAKDTFNWYSYSVSASTERQRWIMYATFGHTAAELSNPVLPAEDERDSIINILPHVEFLG